MVVMRWVDARFPLWGFEGSYGDRIDVGGETERRLGSRHANNGHC